MKTREMTVIAHLVAILIATQFVLSAVVGINLVFPLLVIYTYTLGFRKTILIMTTFVLVRFLMGLPLLTVILWSWTFAVLIVLAFAAKVIARENEYIAATITLVYFLLFGFLCAIQETILTGVPILAYWLRGVPSDVLGAIAGFVSVLILFHPIRKTIKYAVYGVLEDRVRLTKKQAQE